MAILAIDHVVVAVADVNVAAEPWERLGFRLTPRMEHAGAGTANRVLMVGSSAANAVYVEFLEVHDPALATAPGLDHYRDVAAAGGGFARLMLSVDSTAPTAAALAAAGITSSFREVFRDDGSRIGSVLTPADGAPLGLEIGFIAYDLPADARFESRSQSGLFDHGFPLKRLDHLAAIPADADTARRLWQDVLAIPQSGEVVSATAYIRQFRVGDAIVEHLVALNAESPIASRPRGPISMAAFEVADIASAVGLARERGFTVPDPGPGPLPGTHTATIPAGELGGLALQLLQYV